LLIKTNGGFIDLQKIVDAAGPVILAFGLKIIGALAAWIAGRWLIGVVVNIVSSAMERQKIDPTLTRYMGSVIAVALNIVLVVGILGYFGIETTSFAALMAAMGIAIGAAWGGLLANFAAGAFLLVLRPFKTGDFVTVGGLTGTVKEIGLFATTIVLPDNVVTFVGNNKVFSDTIQNFSATPFRRVERTAQLAHSVDANDAIRRLREALVKIPNVVATPAPDVEIIDFNAMGPVLAVRPYTHNDNYWQVYFDTNKLIRETFGAAGYPVPEAHYAHRNT
jgi:small conductance mechanosensitive channel